MQSQMQLRNKTHAPQLQSVDSCPSNDAALDTLMRSTTPAFLLPAVPGVQHTAISSTLLSAAAAAAAAGPDVCVSISTSCCLRRAGKQPPEG